MTTSIIIPFRDKSELTNECLRTLANALLPTEVTDVEILLVNNGSSPNELKKLVLPSSLDIKQIDLDIEFNFQKLNNIAAAQARGDILLLLNNDITFPPEARGFLTKLSKIAKQPEIGAVGPLLFYPDGTIQHAGVIVGMNTYADHLYRGWTEEQAEAFPFTSFKDDRYVSAVTGAFLLIEARKYHEVKGMDERFIVCGGDVDLCLRLSLAGYKNVYAGSIRCIHLESKSRDPGKIPTTDFSESRRSYDAFLNEHNGRDPFYPAPLPLTTDTAFTEPPLHTEGKFKSKARSSLRQVRRFIKDFNSRLKTEPLELIVANKLIKLRRKFGASKFRAVIGASSGVEWYRRPYMEPLGTIRETPLAPRPRLNILLPHYNDRDVFAGITTAVALGAKVALKHPDIDLRYVFVDGIAKKDALRRDLRSIIGNDADRLDFTCREVFNRKQDRLSIHDGDVFLATAWWTCYQIHSIIGDAPFLYLIQDYECGFYPWSDQFANCLATYSMNYIPFFNTSILRDFFIKQGLTKPEIAEMGGYFEPAVSPDLFNVPRRKKATNEKRRLFFYGREHVTRNLFPIGVCAIAEAINQGIFDPKEWEFVSAGQSHDPILLGNGATLISVGKMSLSDYAKFLSEVDIGLSLMLSPHPSYPPLEIAAAGALSVTNSFENKDLSKLSSNIISCPPSIKGVAEGLRRAAVQLESTSLDTPQKLALPTTWDEAFDTTVECISSIVKKETTY